MNNATIGAALLGGYVLGRTKKGKLAVTAATWMLRKKINPKEIASAVTGSPAMDALGERIRKELVTAGKEAATTAVAARADRLADTLHSRTAGLREGLPSVKGGEDEDRAAGEEPEDEDRDEQQDRDEPEDEDRDEQEDRGGKKDQGGKEDREQRQDGAEDEGGEPGAEEEERPKPRKRSAKAGSQRPRRTSGDKEGGAARQKKSSGTARRSGA
ncbi:ABC transporter substrate-binding protein [Streptomyces lavendulocolor]|uniref:ABC transporter substrate-binding protein n=1 Tax=Streptomyces lavendulocolor TaxID=67316 RepID=UPI003C2AD3BD